MLGVQILFETATFLNCWGLNFYYFYYLIHLNEEDTIQYNILTFTCCDLIFYINLLYN
jgi:hypothetical protein